MSHPHNYERTEVDISVPGEHDASLRLVHLSDLHFGGEIPTERIVHALNAVRQAAPQALVLTGDFVTSPKDPVESLGDVLAGLPCPAFAVLGNHDHDAGAQRVTRQLRRAGIHVLSNQNTRMSLGGRTWNVVGVDDGVTGHDDVVAAFHGHSRAHPTLVLSHSPMISTKLPREAGLTCFSGHTHGGQIHVPGITRLICRFAGQNYVRGLYSVRGNALYVNRGLGYGERWVPRWGARPELTCASLTISNTLKQFLPRTASLEPASTLVSGDLSHREAA